MAGIQQSAAGALTHNLPAGLSRCIGREHELAVLTNQVAAHSLVTLTGPGGVGKTRLALAVAEELRSAFPDGVWLVELAPLADPALAPGAVAQVLGVHEESGRSLPETLVDALRERCLLLILDNCEHLLEACRELVDVLLGSCRSVHILATSRRRLRHPQERRHPIPPLSLSSAHMSAEPEDVAQCPAVLLFMDRARAVEPAFRLDAANASAVAAICARLDGLPLAIELAAARIQTHRPEQLVIELEARLRMLQGGRRGLPARQRTMQGMLDWSYTLLEAGEQALFARLSVFARGWTAQAAQAVCVVGDDLPFPVEEGLASLAEQSLLSQELVSGRYRMLETVREYAAYALERLAGAEDKAAVREQHARYFLALAEEAEPRLAGPEQGTWLDLLEADHDNLRAALRWAREQHAVEVGLRLAGGLWFFWWVRGYLREGLGWLIAVLADEGGAPAQRATVLNGAGNLAQYQGDSDHAVGLYAESLAIRRSLGDRVGIARTLSNLGTVAHDQGDCARAAALYEESLALYRALEDPLGIANVLGELGTMAQERGEHERAALLYQDSLVSLRRLGDKLGIAGTLSNLGNAVYDQGNYERAAALYEESIGLFGELGHTLGIALSLEGLGLVAIQQGEHQRAAERLEESLALFRQLGDKHGCASSLIGLGLVAAMRGDYVRALELHRESLSISRGIGVRALVAKALQEIAATATAMGQPRYAARLGGAAASLQEDLGISLPADKQSTLRQMVQDLRAMLGTETFTAVWDEGRALSLEDALAEAVTQRGDE